MEIYNIPFFFNLLDEKARKKKYNSTVSHECRFGKLKASQANKTKDWALVQNAALVMKIKVLKLGLVR